MAEEENGKPDLVSRSKLLTELTKELKQHLEGAQELEKIAAVEKRWGDARAFQCHADAWRIALEAIEWVVKHKV